MLVKIVQALTKALELLNKITEVFTYALTGYAKVEAKKEELEQKMSDYARYIIIGALTGGAALLAIFIVKKIVKCCKKRKLKRAEKQMEAQRALEM